MQIAELIDVQIMDGQQCLSRYHYLDTTGTALLSTLVSDYETDPVPALTPLQSSNCIHVATRYRLVYPTATLLTEHAYAIARPGTQSGSPAQAFTTYSGKYSLGDTTYLAGGATGHIRKGGKHLPGVVVTETLDQPYIDAGAQAQFQTWFAKAMDPASGSWHLVVASFELVKSSRVNTHTTFTLTKAVLSPTVTKYCPVTAISPISVSTQNTRKVLRGRTY